MSSLLPRPVKVRRVPAQGDAGEPDHSSARVARCRSRKQWFALLALLVVFGSIQCLLPLRTAVKIGADEDYELSKVTLLLKGYKFYSEVWNDQPLLHTWIVAKVLTHWSHSVLAARLVTIVFAAVLLVAIFLISLRVGGLSVAALTVALMIVSPGFVELSGSCMVEIPALAPAVAALAVLARVPQRPVLREILSGLLFAAALQIKFINVILLPLAALIMWLGARKATLSGRSAPTSFVLFGASIAISFVGIGVLIGEGSYWLQLKQSWGAHFASTKSFEYGSPADHPFEWSIFLKNWDTTVPAILGIVVCLRQLRTNNVVLIPLVWFVLELIVFGTHKPWWSYYYIHNTIPLCWCAAIGITSAVRVAKQQRRFSLLALFTLFAFAAGMWAVSRVYLQVLSIRSSPKLYSALVLKEIERFKPFTRFIYTDEPVYSFHSGIPLPPKLAVVSLKRFWSGDMTNARLVEELRAAQPGIILLMNDARDLPFHEWLNREYRLVFQDDKHRLYAHSSVINKAEY